MKAVPKKQGKQSVDVAEKTKADIIVSATELFSTKGFDATSLREIASVSGLTHGTLRHHFGSKLDIWKAVTDQVLEHYQQRLFPILMEATQSDQPLLSFKNVVREFIAVSNENPTFARLLIKEVSRKNERSDYFQTHFIKIHTLIEVLFKKAQTQSPKLTHFTNDSFFLALMSLTFFPLLLSEIKHLLPTSNIDEFAERENMIMNILFG